MSSGTNNLSSGADNLSSGVYTLYSEYVTAYGNGGRLSGQPLMETEGGCLSNRFIQPQQVTQHSMQPL
jgi:X-X-X-Leu-X-X-Gly heptad repeat protein